MSFYKMFAEMGAKEALGSDAEDAEVEAALKDSEDALTSGHAVFLEVQRVMVEGAKKAQANTKNKKLGAMNATMVLFSVGWHIIAWLYRGVEPGLKQEGKTNMVYRLWELMKATFGETDKERMTENIARLTKEWGDE